MPRLSFFNASLSLSTEAERRFEASFTVFDVSDSFSSEEDGEADFWAGILLISVPLRTSEPGDRRDAHGVYTGVAVASFLQARIRARSCILTRCEALAIIRNSLALTRITLISMFRMHGRDLHHSRKCAPRLLHFTDDFGVGVRGKCYPSDVGKAMHKPRNSTSDPPAISICSALARFRTLRAQRISIALLGSLRNAG